MHGALALCLMTEVPLALVFGGEFDVTRPLAAASLVAAIAHMVLETRTIVLVHGAPDARPSAILRDYLISARILIDAVSLAAVPLAVYVWRPLGLLCGPALDGDPPGGTPLTGPR